MGRRQFNTTRCPILVVVKVMQDWKRHKKGKNGKPGTRRTVWVAGHKRKNGEPVNEFAKEKIDKLNEINYDIECRRGNALSQVLGPDPNGHARGVGYGVTPSTLSVIQQCSGRMSELQEKYDVALEEIYSVKKLIGKLLNSEETNHSFVQPSPEIAMNPQSPSFQNNHNLNFGLTKLKDMSTERSLEGRRDHQSLFVPSNQNSGVAKSKVVSTQRPTHQAQRDHQSPFAQSNQNLISGTKSKVVKCKLFRLVPEDAVAEGFWYTDYPAATVHTKPLGPDYSKVSVEGAIQKDALFVRGNNALRTIEDAVSSFVAWPTNSIIKL